MCISFGSGSIRWPTAGHRSSSLHHQRTAIMCWALHKELIRLFIFQSPQTPIILGLPWLERHNPSICWSERQITQWSEYCQRNCLHFTSVKGSSDTSKKQLPSEYHDLTEAFSKTKSTQLPPHRAGDCAIDLQPGSQPPKGRILPLSQPEAEAMKSYIEEELAKGFIRPSTSPASAGFSSSRRRMGGLRPCIDYRGLNEISIKFRYPLPLVPAALEQLGRARYFTKLDLRSAYNLIRIREGDEWKTAFSTTSGHYEYRVMPFGLSNSPFSIPVIHQWGVQRHAKPLANCLHWRYPNIFQITQGTRSARPGRASSTHRPPAVCQGWEMWISPGVSIFPRLCDQFGRGSHGRSEGPHCR